MIILNTFLIVLILILLFIVIDIKWGYLNENR